MTCIIGLKHDDEIYIGGDQLASNTNGFCSTYKEPKVFKKGGFIFGYSGSYRVGQILKYDFDIPSHSSEYADMEYFVRIFVPALQLKLEERKAIYNSDNGLEMADDANIIIGYRNGIYRLHSDFQLENNENDIMAIGCGSTVALGCMHALYNLKPISRITRSLEIVSILNIGVKGPFTILQS